MVAWLIFLITCDVIKEIDAKFLMLITEIVGYEPAEGH